MESYAIKHAYGNMIADSSDNSDYDDYTKKLLENATPNTKRRLKEEIEEEVTGKVGLASTFFTLLKGFVAAGVLFLPKGFVTGGWTFMTGSLIFSCCLTIFASIKLIQVRLKHKLSFPEIGEKAYGRPGKIAVDFFLAVTQTFFVCAYIAFIASSFNNIIVTQFSMKKINPWYIGIG